MTFVKGKKLQFRGKQDADLEMEDSVQKSLDEIGSSMARLESDLKEKTREKEKDRTLGSSVCSVRVFRNNVFDGAGRFLRATATRPAPGSSVNYEFFQNGTSRGETLPLLNIGRQFTYMGHRHDTNDVEHGRVSASIFCGVVYDIPWHGDSVPSEWHGPIIAVNKGGGYPKTGDITYSGPLDDPAPPPPAFLGSADRYGDPHLMGSFYSGSGANEERAGSQGQGWLRPTIGWEVTPFFFYEGRVPECKEFLQNFFGGVSAGVSTVGTYTSSIADEHARLCITTKDSFPALVVAKMVFATNIETDDFDDGFYTGAAESPDTTDVKRAHWSIELKGTQRIIVK